ncbi:MAG: carboxypeptidase regulatory-like domain-containing protein [Thermoanaerobaculia bacterium]
MKRNALLIPMFALGLVAVACGRPAEEAPEAETAPAGTAAAPAAPSVDLSNAGTVTGTVSYTGEDPDRELDMGADPTCAELHDQPVMTETVVGDGAGHLGNVFVYVKQGLEGEQFPVPQAQVEIDQQGCAYAPHVLGMMAGQTLLIKNSDPTLHNVHARPEANREFNQGQPFQGMTLEKVFDKAELSVPFKCDVHPWMSATLHVVENPYFAISAEDGTFTIDQLPPGDYMLEAVHENLGTREASVTVPPNGAAGVTFDFSGGAAAAPAG